MDRSRSGERLEELFEQAARRAPGERRAFLIRACGGDRALRSEVESLLRAEERAGELLGRLTADEPSEEPGGVAEPLAPGRLVGAYQLFAKIGDGGMSTVYLAARADDQYRKRVAIKLVPLAMASADHLRRFRTERHILASLDHPNIARLYDAGTEDGLPYFVMEYIEGEPIDVYCDRHRLSVRERLELFRTVCSAVHYAHQNLVVHRDLKPSNILVTEGGVPRLLDFGIAKLLNPELTSPSLQPTLTWHRVLTPDYASPEQVQGRTITTASDVYSLGVLLYKLLTGRLPHRLGDKAPSEIERILTTEEPERPSTTVSRMEGARDGASPTPESVSHERQVRPAELRRRLAGDLDNIVMMALRKESRRRYGSAEQLAEDVRRHLSGLPVLARGDALGYRFGKFIRRHRLAVSVVALLAVLVAGFALVMAVQSARVSRERDQARLERDKSTQALRFIEEAFQGVAPGTSRGQPLTPQQILERGVELQEGLKNQPAVQASILNSLGNLHRNLGLYERADELLRRALAIRESVLGAEHQDVAESLNDLSLLLMDQGKFGEAGPLLDRALEIRRRVFGDEHPEVAETVNNVGLIHQNQGDYDAAESHLRHGLELNRRIFGTEHRYVALSLNNLATALAQKGDYRAGEAALREVLEIQHKTHGNTHPEIARTLGNLGQVLRARGDLDAAEGVFREALAMQRSLVGDEHLDVAVAVTNLGIVLEGKGDYEAAESHLRSSLTLWLEIFGRGHWRTGVSLYFLARTLAGKGEHGEAEALYQEVLAVFRETLPEGHHYLAHPLAGLGRLFLERGQPREALPLLRQAIEQERRTLPEDHVDVAEVQSLLGECLVRLGELEEAEPLLLGSYPLVRDQRGARHRQARRALERIVELYDSWDRPQEAARYRGLLAELELPSAPSDPLE